MEEDKEALAKETIAKLFGFPRRRDSTAEGQDGGGNALPKFTMRGLLRWRRKSQEGVVKRMELLDTASSYMPNLAIEHLLALQSDAEVSDLIVTSEKLDCALVIADMSGFTKLAEKLKRGDYVVVQEPKKSTTEADSKEGNVRSRTNKARVSAMSASLVMKLLKERQGGSEDEKAMRGAEELRKVLNIFCGRLMDIVIDFGGDILRLAGDAVIAIFPVASSNSEIAAEHSATTTIPNLQEAGYRARDCSLELLRSLNGLEFHNEKLKLHIGIGIGRVHCLHVGGVGGIWVPVIQGSPLRQAADLLDRAKPGEIILSKQVVRVLCRGDMNTVKYAVGGTLLEDNCVLLDLSDVAAAEAGLIAHYKSPLFRDRDKSDGTRERLIKHADANSSWMALALRSYLPSTVLMNLEAEKRGLLAELRWVTVIFLKLEDKPSDYFDQTKKTTSQRLEEIMKVVHDKEDKEEERSISLYDIDEENDGTSECEATDRDRLAYVQNPFSVLLEVLVRHDGVLKEFSVDDKGTVFIAGFGLPPVAHADKAVRGAQAACEMLNALHKIGRGASIGVTTGQVFCGTVGSQRRREFAMIGAPVNLAARLMQASKGGILCDEATQRAATGLRLTFERLKPIMVKGREQPVEIFRPQVSGGATTYVRARKASQAGLAPELIGRTEVKSALLERLQKLWRGAGGGVVWLEGVSGIGKTTLTKGMQMQAHAYGARVIKVDCSISKQTAFASIVPVLNSLYELHTQMEAKEKTRRLIQCFETNYPNLIGTTEERLELSCFDEILGTKVLEDEFLFGEDREIRERVSGFYMSTEKMEDVRKHFIAATLSISASESPMFLIVEDAHNADDRTLDCLRYLMNGGDDYAQEYVNLLAGRGSMQASLKNRNSRDLMKNAARRMSENTPSTFLSVVNAIMPVGGSSRNTKGRRRGFEAAAAVAASASKNILICVTSLPVSSGMATSSSCRRLARSSVTSILHVDGMDASDVEEFILLSINGATKVDETLLAMLLVRTGGNPCYISYLLGALKASECLEIDDQNCIIIKGDAKQLHEVGIPYEVQSIITSQMGRLSPSLQMVLKVSSVLGKSIWVPLLVDIYPLAEQRESLQLDLTELQETGFLEKCEADESDHTEIGQLNKSCYRFAVPLVQEVIYGLLPFEQRTKIHNEVAHWMESQLSPRYIQEFLPDLVHHYTMADNEVKAQEFIEKTGVERMESYGIQSAQSMCGSKVSIKSKKSWKIVFGITVPWLRGVEKATQAARATLGTVLAAQKFKRLHQRFRRTKSKIGLPQELSDADGSDSEKPMSEDVIESTDTIREASQEVSMSLPDLVRVEEETPETVEASTMSQGPAQHEPVESPGEQEKEDVGRALAMAMQMRSTASAVEGSKAEANKTIVNKTEKKSNAASIERQGDLGVVLLPDTHHRKGGTLPAITEARESVESSGSIQTMRSEPSQEQQDQQNRLIQGRSCLEGSDQERASEEREAISTPQRKQGQYLTSPSSNTSSPVEPTSRKQARGWKVRSPQTRSPPKHSKRHRPKRTITAKAVSPHKSLSADNTPLKETQRVGSRTSKTVAKRGFHISPSALPRSRSDGSDEGETGSLRVLDESEGAGNEAEDLLDPQSRDSPVDENASSSRSSWGDSKGKSRPSKPSPPLGDSVFFRRHQYSGDGRASLGSRLYEGVCGSLPALVQRPPAPTDGRPIVPRTTEILRMPVHLGMTSLQSIERMKMRASTSLGFVPDQERSLLQNDSDEGGSDNDRSSPPPPRAHSSMTVLEKKVFRRRSADFEIETVKERYRRNKQTKLSRLNNSGLGGSDGEGYTYTSAPEDNEQDSLKEQPQVDALNNLSKLEGEIITGLDARMMDCQLKDEADKTPLKWKHYEPLLRQSLVRDVRQTRPQSPPHRREKKAKTQKRAAEQSVATPPSRCIKSPYIATPFTMNGQAGGSATSPPRRLMEKQISDDDGFPAVKQSPSNGRGAIRVERPGTPSGVSFFDDGSSPSSAFKPRFPRIDMRK